MRTRGEVSLWMWLLITIIIFVIFAIIFLVIYFNLIEPKLAVQA